MERRKCKSRDMLEAIYLSSLREYSETMSSLAKTKGFLDAGALSKALYEECKAARDNLRDHEAQHGCNRVPAHQSSAARTASNSYSAS